MQNNPEHFLGSIELSAIWRDHVDGQFMDFPKVEGFSCKGALARVLPVRLMGYNPFNFYCGT